MYVLFVDRIDQLAQEGHGAVEVDEAVETPLIVFLAGPIKYWWGKFDDGSDIWGCPLHLVYERWRDAVRVAVVQTGWAVTYSPHRAIQGAWHEDLQRINDQAIAVANAFVDLTPLGVPADGTKAEIRKARECGTLIVDLPPSDDKALASFLRLLESLR